MRKILSLYFKDSISIKTFDCSFLIYKDNFDFILYKKSIYDLLYNKEVQKQITLNCKNRLEELVKNSEIHEDDFEALLRAFINHDFLAFFNHFDFIEIESDL